MKKLFLTALLFCGIIVLAGCPCDPETGFITFRTAGGIYTQDNGCVEIPNLVP